MRSLAKQIDVHWTLLSQWEHGQTLVHLSRVASISSALGLFPAQLRAFIDYDIEFLRASKKKRLLTPGPTNSQDARGVNAGGTDDG